MSSFRELPTHDDFAMFQRQLQRVLRECRAHRRTPQETRGIVMRWTRDYLDIPTRLAMEDAA